MYGVDFAVTAVTKTRTVTSINKAKWEDKKRMSEQEDWNQEDWTSRVEEYRKLDDGENTVKIKKELYIKSGKYGERLFVPTSEGDWPVSLNSPIARKLKAIHKENSGRLSNVVLTVFKTGSGKDTRYTITKVVLPGQKQEKQAKLDLSNLTPEQKKQFEDYINQSREPEPEYDE